MRRLGGQVITLSGFNSNNALRSLGDVNFWLDSTDYGMVEIGHQFVVRGQHDIASSVRVEKFSKSPITCGSEIGEFQLSRTVTQPCDGSALGIVDGNCCQPFVLLQRACKESCVRNLAWV